MNKLPYSSEPADHQRFTQRFDKAYARTARAYDWAVRHLPLWKRWLRKVLPHVQGPRVLEVSFGTGYLLTQYPEDLEVHGVDLNTAMTQTAKRNIERAGRTARIVRGNVERLPFPNGAFDSVVNTMAFTGYPDAERAMSELCRVLRPDGSLVMLDINFPQSNRLGYAIARLWQASGDLVRDMSPLFRHTGLRYTDSEVGGLGSVHLYVARKASRE